LTKIVLTDSEPLELKAEDSGCALLGEAGGETTLNDLDFACEDEDDGLFVRIQSWDQHRGEGEGHYLIKLLRGKKLRVTIETLED